MVTLFYFTTLLVKVVKLVDKYEINATLLHIRLK
jgi:hypothetical protein